MLLGFEIEILVKFTLLFWVISALLLFAGAAVALIGKAIYLVIKSWRSQW